MKKIIIIIVSIIILGALGFCLLNKNNSKSNEKTNENKIDENPVQVLMDDKIYYTVPKKLYNYEFNYELKNNKILININNKSNENFIINKIELVKDNKVIDEYIDELFIYQGNNEFKINIKEIENKNISIKFYTKYPKIEKKDEPKEESHLKTYDCLSTVKKINEYEESFQFYVDFWDDKIVNSFYMQKLKFKNKDDFNKFDRTLGINAKPSSVDNNTLTLQYKYGSHPEMNENETIEEYIKRIEKEFEFKCSLLKNNQK